MTYAIKAALVCAAILAANAYWQPAAHINATMRTISQSLELGK